MKENEYPWCSNSRRWLTVDFDFKMPKTCPYETEKCCKMEQCAYFSWQEETAYLKKKREIMKRVLDGAEIITNRKQWEGGIE